MTTPYTDTSKMGVQVPDQVQDDNRSLVQYCHDGSIRNKLGEATSNHITLGIAMYFWQNPEELEVAARSEYVDDPSGFVSRVKHYQEQHIDALVEASRRELGDDHRNPTASDLFAEENTVGGDLALFDGASTNNEFEPEAHATSAEETNEVFARVVRERLEQQEKQIEQQEKQIHELEKEMKKIREEIDNDS